MTVGCAVADAASRPSWSRPLASVRPLAVTDRQEIIDTTSLLRTAPQRLPYDCPSGIRLSFRSLFGQTCPFQTALHSSHRQTLSRCLFHSCMCILILACILLFACLPFRLPFFGRLWPSLAFFGGRHSPHEPSLAPQQSHLATGLLPWLSPAPLASAHPILDKSRGDEPRGDEPRVVTHPIPDEPRGCPSVGAPHGPHVRSNGMNAPACMRMYTYVQLVFNWGEH